ncbi:MAG: hypothetical protein ABIL58_14295 [Pseudomonadota bacterium]
MIFILQHLSAEAADIYALVLTAEGIPYHMIKAWSGWSILVPERHGARAILAIDRYRHENPETAASDSATSTTRALRQASW